jgi:hypothetical protein
MLQVVLLYLFFWRLTRPWLRYRILSINNHARLPRYRKGDLHKTFRNYFGDLQGPGLGTGYSRSMSTLIYLNIAKVIFTSHSAKMLRFVGGEFEIQGGETSPCRPHKNRLISPTWGRPATLLSTLKSFSWVKNRGKTWRIRGLRLK